jgi:hypothetical protein
VNRRSFLALAPVAILVAPEVPKRVYSFLWERSRVDQFQAFYEALARETVGALGLRPDDYIFRAGDFASTAFGRIGFVEMLLEESIIRHDTAIDLLA